ncbi:hypothetical protein MRY87_01445 [bacterium]|nr:hypothetical protein [bacterium]
MELLPIIKLAIDIALAGTVFYLAVKVARRRGPSPAEVSALQTLEESLARLLREAGSAGEDLQKALSKEQKKLEELLFDIESVEHRVNKGLDEAQQVQRALRRSAQEHSTRSVAPPEEPSSRPQKRAAEESRPHAGSETVIQPRHEYQASPGDTRFDRITTEFARAAESPHRSQEGGVRQAEEPPRAVEPQRGAVNIFGDPIGSTSPSPASLRERVEREHHASPKRAQESVPPEPLPQSLAPNGVQYSLEDIYAQCEELLNAGRSLQQVATMMNLSVNELEVLQGLMQFDEEEERGQPSPPEPSVVAGDRLGVLAGSRSSESPIGRTTQVVS